MPCMLAHDRRRLGKCLQAVAYEANQYERLAASQLLRTGNGTMMDTPANLDSFLANLLAGQTDDEPAPNMGLDGDDRSFVDKMLESVTTGSKAIFVVLHPNDRMQYMLLNSNRAGAIALLASVMRLAAEALESDVE